MSTIAEILDFETHVETPIAEALNAAISVSGFHAYPQLATATKKAPYVNVQIQLGEPQGHVALVGTATTPYWDTFYAILNFEIVTKRTGASSVAAHGPIRGAIRALMQNLAFDQTMLPLHSVPIITEAGSQPRIEDENDLDTSAIAFNLLLNVRANAWPTA